MIVYSECAPGVASAICHGCLYGCEIGGFMGGISYCAGQTNIVEAILMSIGGMAYGGILMTMGEIIKHS